MRHNFKPGDLVLIVGSESPDSPNVGMAAELVHMIFPGDRFTAPDGRPAMNVSEKESWMLSAPGLLARNSDGAWIDRGGIAFTQEHHLMPLRGDFTPEQQKAKEAEPCL